MTRVVGPLSGRRIGPTSAEVGDREGDHARSEVARARPPPARRRPSPRPRIGLGGRGSLAKSPEPQAGRRDAAATPSSHAPPDVRAVSLSRHPIPIAANLADERLAGVSRPQNGSSTTSAPTPRSPTSTRAPGLGLAADHRQRDRAERGGDDRRSRPRRPPGPPSAIGSPSATGRLEAQPAQVAVRLALVVEPGDRLLADVAALGEAHGAIVDPGLLGDRRPRSSRARTAGARTRPEGSRPPPR